MCQALAVLSSEIIQIPLERLDFCASDGGSDFEIRQFGATLVTHETPGLLSKLDFSGNSAASKAIRSAPQCCIYKIGSALEPSNLTLLSTFQTEVVQQTHVNMPNFCVRAKRIMEKPFFYSF